MITKQTEALRLVDYLKKNKTDPLCFEAAVELYRLHDVNAKLVEAIANLIDVKGRHNTEIAYQRLVTAYDKATGEQHAD